MHRSSLPSSMNRSRNCSRSCARSRSRSRAGNRPGSRLGASVLILASAACSSVPAEPPLGPDLPVPVFAADDPRVAQPGFVGHTQRVDRDRDGVRHSLFTFAVGDTLSLGAMVDGPFRGELRWRVGTRRLALPFDTDDALRDVPVTVDAALSSSGLVAQGAEFRGTTWLVVELPLRDWLGDGAALQLEFAPDLSPPLVLPAGGRPFAARPVQGSLRR